MSVSRPEAVNAQATLPRIDPAQLQYALETLRSQQNLLLAGIGGAVAALVGAALWAAITVSSGYQIGLVAIGVGLLVGFSVRTLGRGIDRSFGIVGGTLALIGCVLGNLLAVCAILASHQGIPLREAFGQLDFGSAWRITAATFDPMDLIFYGIAVYEGYRLSFRQVTREELEQLLGTRA